MCGLAGVLHLHAPGTAPPHPLEAIPEHWLDILDDSIKHRGPDGQGRFRDRAVRPDGTVVDVALVHRRLSILDHAGGHQPMVHDGQRLRPDLTYQPGEAPILAHERCPPTERPGLAGTDLAAVVFNGCIYNHRELRRELVGLGHRFGTDHSDTEVLLHGWRAWGLHIITELDGMYALVLWDRSTAQLAWARDLAGEKPLYHACGQGGTVLCTNVPGIAKLDLEIWSRPTKPHWLGLPRWLSDGAGSNLPLSVYSAPQGQMHITPSTPRRGGSIHFAGHDGTAPTATLVSHMPRRGDRGRRLVKESGNLAGLLESALASRLEADAPLGVFLSGGLDSAIIAAIAHKSRPDIRAFTVRMQGSVYDESAAASETANAIGIDHTILDCEPNPAGDLVGLVERLGLPFGDSSLLPTYWVSKAARDHVKVALSGDGGDELFGGYRRYGINPVLNRWRAPLRWIPTWLLDQRTPSSRSTYLARLATAARHGGYNELLSIFPTPDLRRLIAEIDGESARDATFRRIDDPLRYDFEHYLPDDLLRKTDTASMAVGLEVRAPFLARELIEAALRTPLETLMPGGERKGLLKQVARLSLPEHIVNRPKQGFAIPVGDWFRSDFGGMRTLLHDHLRSADPFPGLAEAGIEINGSFVRRMLAEHDAAGEKSINPWHGRDHSQRLYMLLVLSIWCRWLARLPRS